jgi:hypothetical protein
MTSHCIFGAVRKAEVASQLPRGAPEARAPGVGATHLPADQEVVVRAILGTAV